MTATKGQPGTKPQSLPAPVPGADAAKADQDFLSSFDSEDIAFQSSFAADEVAAPPAEPEFESPIYTKYLPEVGGLVGGIAGGIAGAPAGGVGAVPGAIGGAALGGAAGAAYRDLIETQLLGRKPKDSVEVATDIAKSGAIEGGSQAIGGIVGKGLGMIGSKALKYGDDAIRGIKGAVSEAKNAVEEPLTKLLFERATALTPKESGDAVKKLIVGNIQGKYAPFTKAYGELDQIGAALPLKDEARMGLTGKIREWAASELGGDDARIVRKFVDDLDAADNGMKLRNVISQIGDARSSAYQSGATQQARTLKALQEKANDFMEGETTKLAQRISAGKAAPGEMAFLQQLAQTRGVQEADPTKYAKSLAKDYLKSIDKVRSDYKGFRSFLEDVAEQTKTKATNKGPVSFLDDIKNVPSEKLIEKMFDPKNSKALQQMRAETPEVFAEVAKARVKNLMEKASPTGELDLVALQKQVMKLPPDTRKLLFSPEDLKLLNTTALSPKLKRLGDLEKGLDSKMLGYLQEISTIVGKKTPQAVKVPLRQAVGAVPARTGVGIGEMLLRSKGEEQKP